MCTFGCSKSLATRRYGQGSIFFGSMWVFLKAITPNLAAMWMTLKWVQVPVCVCARVYIHTYVRTYIPTYIHTLITYIHTDRQTDIQTYRHTDIQTYIHTYIYIYIHTYIDTHTHLYNMTSQKSERVSLTPLVESHDCNNSLIFSVPKFLDSPFCPEFLDPPPLGGARIIHIRSGGFDTVNVIDGAIDGEPPPDGLSVQLEQDLHGIANAPLMNVFPIKPWFLRSSNLAIGHPKMEVFMGKLWKIIISGGFPS